MISQWGQRKVNTKCSFSFDEANIKSLYVGMKAMLSNAGGTQRMQCMVSKSTKLTDVAQYVESREELKYNTSFHVTQ